MTLQDYLHALQGKRVAVIGIGVSNQPLLRLLLEAGVSVTACDKKDRAALGPMAHELEAAGCALRLGEDYLEGLDQDVIFRTPGLHPRYLEAARARGSVVTSEMEVFFEVCPCPILAVTGSDGKTTTTTIIARLLQAAGHKVHLGGNIGHPLLSEADDIRPEDWAVVELSSFQLLTMRRSPRIAVLTNLAPNHLDIHTDMAEYINAKAALLDYQSSDGTAVCNWDNDITRELSGRTRGKVFYFTRNPEQIPAAGCFLRGEAIWYRDENGEREVLPLADILLPGVHNVENCMAAICAVQGLVPDGVIRDFARTFGGVEHRIELVRERRGVRWYNDSIASSPSRTMAGLRSFQSKVILIAGGKDKGISYAPLGPVINEHVKLLILCGATAGAIRTAAVEAANYGGLEIHEAADYPAAVTLAAERAGEGDVVILSPASTSFDRFKNFEERGQVFKELVRALPE
ncbi:MAG: UDP-N-acetylmuramoyl-L-alanine--D-glutamate ligase [Oscillospiraceae bacterium]|jgi:UDP-N-acetylmuramoylalanine--D-glutamate ligase|nr:UDP-N-acetylmuramoyl-L-alanine--D-glutamate ligase [Oscillospiraceae bacterium]